MRKKTHQNPDKYDDIYGDSRYLSPPHLTRSPLIICNSDHTINKKERPSDQTAGSGSNPGKWSLGSLMAALPFTPSPVCSPTVTGSDSSPSSSPLLEDISRGSAEFYTPTHQCSSVQSSLSFRKQEQSPKCRSISTLYESTIDHQGYKLLEKRQGNALESYTYSPKRLLPSAAPYAYEFSTATAEVDDIRVSYPFLPCVSKERGYHAMNCEDFARAEPVTAVEDEEEEHSPPVNRPKPYQDFLDEVQKHKRRAELDALWKAAYTDLLNKLKKKEADIDCWEASQRSKAEFKLDRIERKLDKKRAKATHKMHQKVTEAKMEAERRKARERKSLLKEMAKLPQKSQGHKPTATMLCLPLSSRAG